MITLSAPLQGHVRGVIATDLKLDNFSDWVYAQRPGEHGTAIIFVEPMAGDRLEDNLNPGGRL